MAHSAIFQPSGNQLPSTLQKMPIARRRQKTASERQRYFQELVILTPMRLQKKTVGRNLGTLIGLICVAAFMPVVGVVVGQSTPASFVKPSSGSESTAGTRYGLFNWLDHHSQYGQGIFPEPFLVDDSDLEPDEARLDWLHTAGSGQHADRFKAEIEKSFGQLTLELELPYERNVSSGETTRGIGSPSVGARYPIHQLVSNGGFLDSTLGIGLEAAIPTYSAVSKNAEIVPKVFDDLKLGEHFTLQSVLGYSRLLGGGDSGGLQTFEYGFVFGWTIPRRQLHLPGVQELIPVFELKGETELNKNNPGHNNLLGDLGFRLNLKAIGQVQPRLGLGFVFPIDKGAREDTHWGVVTSLVFQY
jgi:hypothetical protein